MKSWLLLPNVVPEAEEQTDNFQDPMNSTVVEPKVTVFPGEDSFVIDAQTPIASNETLAPEVPILTPEVPLQINDTVRRPKRNRRKPARYRD